jgi:small-conductance mechanosensitive channel
VQFQQIEKRILRLTPALGALAGVTVAVLYGWRWGLGLFVGAILAWLNFRWLQDALDGLQLLSTAQEDAPQPRVPLGTWIRFAGRYVLIAIAIYVIFKIFKVPILSMLVGLCALGAAALAASVYEILFPLE